MTCIDPANRRYVIRTSAFMAIYVALNVAAIFGVFDRLHGTLAAWAWALAAAVSAPIIGQMWATLRLIADSDEFVRALTAKRFILSAFIAMALISTWGFAESYASVPHVPGWMVYPLFWLAFGVVSPCVRSTRA